MSWRHWRGRISSGWTWTTPPWTGRSPSSSSVHFKFHPLAVAAAERFAVRPRFDDYDDFVYMAVRGADPHDTGEAEVHCFWTDRYIVTVHRGDCPSVLAVRNRMDQHHVAANNAAPQIVIVYLITNALVDSFFPVLNEFDDKIDALEDDILKAPTEAQLGVLFDMKRSLMNMRKVIAPERDMMAGITAGVSDVPGMTDEAAKILPRPVRPLDPARRSRRQLPGSLEQRHGHASLHRVEPPQRGDEAVGHHRHHLSAT